MLPTPRRRWLLSAHITLAVLWVAVVAWLVIEHFRVREFGREMLLKRARDISDTIALVTRVSRNPVIRQERMEDILRELIRGEPLVSVALLNSRGEVVASAGPLADFDLATLSRTGAQWGPDAVIFYNVVDFGTHGEPRTTDRPRPIILPADNDDRDAREHRTPPIGPPPAPVLVTTPADTPTTPAARGDMREVRDGPRRSVFGRPPWMSEERFAELVASQGLHGFVLVLSTDPLRRMHRRDLALRLLIALIALAAAGGMGLALTNRDRSTQLLIRLLQSQQQNEHLKEMNLAAAGLAHETRNPLNVVRGLAQMIEQDEALPAETRVRARHIAEEVDHVTYRLGEFIKYSRPLQPRIAPCDVVAVATSVVATLESDLEEKRATIALPAGPLLVEADEMLLRQMLFNLLLNAIHAVGEGGAITISAQRDADAGLLLHIDDNGPGVPPAQREEIFRPYFTNSNEGSGLGLAVVRQIALAHHWTITCTTAPAGGARFTLAGIRALRATV